MVLVAVAVMWTGLLAVGWALIYLPQLPGSYDLAPGLAPSAASGFGTALYVSLATLTTLGANDITPVPDWLRLATAFESLVGAALITAWITWVLSIYPVLAQRRALTYEIRELRRAHPRAEELAGEVPGEVVSEMLRSLTEQILRAGAELGQTRVSYYFQKRSEDLTLARQLPYVLALARAVESSGQEPALSGRGLLLRGAIEALLRVVAAQFLDVDPDEPPDRIIEALARDHLLENPTARE